MKRIVTLILVLCLTFSPQMVFASTASASEENETTEHLTIEEILNDYQQKAFEERTTSRRGSSSTYSCNSGSSAKTLEQETVEILKSAGHEAYNLTSANFDALEAELKTDFTSMGLNTNGSYIVVISGDDNGDNNTNSRAGNLIEQVGGTGDDTGGSSVIMHTFNGKTYMMRNVTITATDYWELGQAIEPIDLLDQDGVGDFLENLSIPVQIISSKPKYSYIGNIYYILSALFPADIASVRSYALTYGGGTNWTVTYTQVFDFESMSWVHGSGVEYVTMHYTINYEYYNPSTNRYEEKDISDYYPILYSEHYEDTNLIRNMAAEAYEGNTYLMDEILSVTYKLNGRTMATHYRWLGEVYHVPE